MFLFHQLFLQMSKTPDLLPRNKEYDSTLVKANASIGANSTIICGVNIGNYSFIGAGSVVTSDVKNYSLVVGNPAKHLSWVSKSGYKLDEKLFCEVEKKSYEKIIFDKK